MLSQDLTELSKIFSELPFNRMIGLRMGDIHQDYVTMSFDMKPELIGNIFYGILHGGVISSVLDMAGGVAVMVAAAHKRKEKTLEELSSILSRSSTVNLHIDYIRPGKGEFFTAKASVIHAGNKISFARMELFNNESTLIANGTGTYLIG